MRRNRRLSPTGSDGLARAAAGSHAPSWLVARSGGGERLGGYPRLAPAVCESRVSLDPTTWRSSTRGQARPALKKELWPKIFAIFRYIKKEFKQNN